MWPGPQTNLNQNSPQGNDAKPTRNHERMHAESECSKVSSFLKKKKATPSSAITVVALSPYVGHPILCPSFQHAPRKKKKSSYFPYTGCLIGILLIVYFNPHRTGQYNPLYTLNFPNHQGCFHCSHVSLLFLSIVPRFLNLSQLLTWEMALLTCKAKVDPNAAKASWGMASKMKASTLGPALVAGFEMRRDDQDVTKIPMNHGIDAPQLSPVSWVESVPGNTESVSDHDSYQQLSRSFCCSFFPVRGQRVNGATARITRRHDLSREPSRSPLALQE